MSDLNPIFTHFVFELSIKWLLEFSWNTCFILLIFSGVKYLLRGFSSFFVLLQDKDWLFNLPIVYFTYKQR